MNVFNFEEVNKSFEVVKNYNTTDYDYKNYFNSLLENERILLNFFIKDSIRTKRPYEEFIVFLNAYMKLRIISEAYKFKYYREKEKNRELTINMKHEFKNPFKKIFK